MALTLGNSGSTRWIRALLAALLLCLAPIELWSQIELQPESPDNQAITALQQLVRNELAVSVLEGQDVRARVTVGTTAFRDALLSDDGRPLIATFISSIDFDAALGPRERPPHISAVFNNPDPTDQLILAQLLLGRPSVGVFDSIAAHALAERIATQHADAVQPISVAPGQSIDSILRAVTTIDAIIVIPDSSVLNRTNVNHAVRVLYQRRKVLIGYSETFTRIGSLASVFPKPDAIARAVPNMLTAYLSAGVLPDPIFIRDVDISINERLARSLNVPVPEKDQLLEALRSLQGTETP